MKKIPLGGSHRYKGEYRINGYALVDDDDFEYLSQWTWNIDSRGYARRTVNVVRHKQYKSVMMHRVIMKVDDPKVFVDHIDFDPLNNQKSNLRLANITENQRHQKPNKKNTSGFKGVSFHTRENKYSAQIRCEGKCFRLGYFKDKVNAARAYNEAAKKYHGEFAYLNPV